MAKEHEGSYEWDGNDVIDYETGEVVISAGDMIDAPDELSCRMHWMLRDAATGDGNAAVITSYNTAMHKLTAMGAAEEYSFKLSAPFIIDALNEFDCDVRGALGIIKYLGDVSEMLTYFFGNPAEAMIELQLIVDMASDELNRDIVRFMPAAT